MQNQMNYQDGDMGKKIPWKEINDNETESDERPVRGKKQKIKKRKDK